MTHEKNSKLVILSEISFILLPLVIFLFVHLVTERKTPFYELSEWSFASIVMFGQSIVKFSQSLAKTKIKIRWQWVALILTVIIILGLVPSVAILIILLTDSASTGWIYFIQGVIFIFAVLVMYNIGGLSVMYDSEYPLS